MTRATIKPRDIVQFSEGAKKGLLSQVILIEGTLKFLCRDWDGSQRTFELESDDFYFVVGTAALGPTTGANPPPAPASAVPPPLNPEELLAPLPPEVKAVPMKVEKLSKKSITPKLTAAKQDTPKFEYIFNVKNALGDVAEVTMKVREDLKPSHYNAGACMRAGTIIPNIKPFTVMGWRRKE